MVTITEDDLANGLGHYRRHYNYGEGGYGYGFQHERFPRFGWIDRVYAGKALAERGISAERWWTVDGLVRESFAAALAALNVGPGLTRIEEEVLARVPDEFAPLRPLEIELIGHDRQDMDDAWRSAVLNAFVFLCDKGQIEFFNAPNTGPPHPIAAIAPHLNTITMVRRRPA